MEPMIVTSLEVRMEDIRNQAALRKRATLEQKAADALVAARIVMTEADAAQAASEQELLWQPA
ncbi:MAG: hypothetical protein JWS12_731 [Candidatus Saccharibacteria bacterium]|nr:hypothetical protein [Candidatus Saccharibacteria bacterium]